MYLIAGKGMKKFSNCLRIMELNLKNKTKILIWVKLNCSPKCDTIVERKIWPYILSCWYYGCYVFRYISCQEMLIIRRLRQAKCIASNLFELCQGKQRRTTINNKIEFNLTNENERVRWDRKQTESLTPGANFHIPHA